jgi:hypothetical protein
MITKKTTTNGQRDMQKKTDEWAQNKEVRIQSLARTQITIKTTSGDKV